MLQNNKRLWKFKYCISVKEKALELKLSSQDGDAQCKNHVLHKLKTMKKKRNQSRREFNTMRKSMLGHSIDYFMDDATALIYANLGYEKLYLYTSSHPLAAGIRLCDENKPENTKVVYQIIFQCLKGKWESPIDGFSHTALHYAVFYNRPTIVEFLLQVAGVHYDVLLLAKNKANKTALDMTRSNMSFYKRLLDLNEHAVEKQKRESEEKSNARITLFFTILFAICLNSIMLLFLKGYGFYTRFNVFLTVIVSIGLGLFILPKILRWVLSLK